MLSVGEGCSWDEGSGAGEFSLSSCFDGGILLLFLSVVFSEINKYQKHKNTIKSEHIAVIRLFT